MRGKVLVVIVLVCLILGMVPIPVATSDSSIPKYMSGVFKSEGFEPSNHLTVPVGSNVDTIITLQGDNNMIGTIKVEIKKDFPGAHDSTHKTLIKQINGINNIEEFNVGSFVASQLTTGNFREYFYRVYWNDGRIYDPTDPDEREWMKTTPISHYFRILKDEIEDKNPDLAGIQGIVEIPFEYYLPPEEGPWSCIVKINDEVFLFQDFAKIKKPSNLKKGVTDRGSIWVASHLFGNGDKIVKIVARRYAPRHDFIEEISLNFQNTFVVPEYWEDKYSESGITPDFHPDFDIKELKKNYSSIYNSLINEWGYEDNEIIGAEVEFVSSDEISLYKLKNALSIGSTLMSLGDISFNAIAVWRTGEGLLKLGKSFGIAILSEGVFIATEAIYKSTNPAEELRFDEAPAGDLAGNRYAVYAMTKSEKDYCNAKINWIGKFPFFLNEKGEWQFYFGNSYEIEEEDAKWAPDADCIESKEMTEEGETKTFTLTIKDKVIPNLQDEGMHLDLELPKGVEISNVRVKGAEDRRLEEGELYKVNKNFNQLTIAKSVKGEKRIAINIPKVYPSAECEEIVVFDITVEKRQPVPLKIFYGLIPTKVHRGNALTTYGWNNLFREDINLITVEHPKGDPKQPDYMVHFYEPFELKHSFEITPRIDFDVLLKPDKTTYQRGETAKVIIDVKNNRNEDTEIWLGTTFKDPEGNEHHIPLKCAMIPKGKTESFDDIEWTIPADAPLGQYEIAVNCWKDAGQNEYYTDNIVWAPIFNVDTTTPVLPPPSPDLIPPPSEFDLDALLALISDFFEAIIGAISDLVSSVQQKPIDVSPEEKAKANVEDALGALAGMADTYSGFMDLITDLAEVEPPKDAEVKFEYHVLSARFCNNIAEAQTYMSSGGIKSSDMNDVLELVRELELAKTGFCIVIVDYSFSGFGEYESGKYPIVCNEKGDPFWGSWQFYEKIKEELETGYKELK